MTETQLRRKVVNQIKSWVGYNDADGSHKKIIDIYNSHKMCIRDRDTVTSFSAALLQGLNGDTAKAAEVADMAITDMADNANKMGTDIKSIQNAYQGFAKGNYTMLDNLKLGYGGTKTEMERLLTDAEKLSGQKYDLSNLNDVYQAIHEMCIRDRRGTEHLLYCAAAESAGHCGRLLSSQSSANGSC